MKTIKYRPKRFNKSQAEKKKTTNKNTLQSLRIKLLKPSDRNVLTSSQRRKDHYITKTRISTDFLSGTMKVRRQ